MLHLGIPPKVVGLIPHNDSFRRESYQWVFGLSGPDEFESAVPLRLIRAHVFFKDALRDLDFKRNDRGSTTEANMLDEARGRIEVDDPDRTTGITANVIGK